MKLILSSGSDEECAICLDSLTVPVITHCAHVFCKPCICQVIQNEQVSFLLSRGSVFDRVVYLSLIKDNIWSFTIGFNNTPLIVNYSSILISDIFLLMQHFQHKKMFTINILIPLTVYIIAVQ